MEYEVYVRDARGTLIEKNPCATPMDGLSWLASQFRHMQGFGDTHTVSCRKISEPMATQWVLSVK